MGWHVWTAEGSEADSFRAPTPYAHAGAGGTIGVGLDASREDNFYDEVLDDMTDGYLATETRVQTLMTMATNHHDKNLSSVMKLC